MTDQIESDVTKSPPKKKLKKNPPKRCEKCNKKIGLLGIKCRCEKVFCAKCIQSSEHNCTFDYKKFHQNELKKNLEIKKDNSNVI